MNGKERTAFVLISIPNGSHALLEIISIINKYQEFILGSINVPMPKEAGSAFGILLNADTDKIGAITGSLGKVAGISIKSAVLSEK